MTKEQAIEWLKSLNYCDGEETQEVAQAIEMGIKALEQQPSDDCVSRKDLLAQINESWETIETKLDFVNIVKASPPVAPAQRWIPVSERLPKAGEYTGDVAKYYLVQNEFGDMLVARYTREEYWEQIYQLQPIGDEIVAWLPLPQPYEERGGANDKSIL